MMKLLIDAGNTRFHWGCYEDGHITNTHSFSYDGNETSLADHLTNIPTPETVLVANVAGDDLATLLNATSLSLWHITPHYISAEKKAGLVTNGYTHTEKLGCDRWSAIVAAYHKAQSAAMVVDCGSTITVDIVDDGGQHQGGLILPGLKFMYRSLINDTAGIKSTFKLPDSGIFLGRNTHDAVNHAILSAAVEFVEHWIKVFINHYGKEASVYLCGGDAEVIRNYLDAQVEIHPHLVLEGLVLIGAEQQ